MARTERFYYFTPTKYALAGVKDRRLKAAELDKANDPYELLPVRCDNEDEKELFTKIKQSVSGDLKMICLSKTYKTPSLWGHYADNCKGIALGFDIEVHEDRMKSHINAIKYLEDKIELGEFGFRYINGELEYRSTEETRKLWHYKSHHWRHEEEWRIWESEENLQPDSVAGLYFLPFGDLLNLREILIGFRCEEGNIERRFERLAAQYPDPPHVIRTRLSYFTFEIEKVT